MSVKLARILFFPGLLFYVADASSVHNSIVIQSSGVVDASTQHSLIRRHASASDANSQQDASDEGGVQTKQAFLNKVDVELLRDDPSDDSCKFDLGTSSHSAHSAGEFRALDLLPWPFSQSNALLEEADSYDKTLSHGISQLLMTNIPPEPIHLRPERKPLVDRSSDTFINRYVCKEEPAITRAFEAIDKRTGGYITRGAVEHSFANLKVGLKITIANQRATMKVHPNHNGVVGHWRYYETQWWGTQLTALLNDLLSEVEIPDMEFAVSMLDGSPDTGSDGTSEVGVFKAEGTVGEDLLMIPRSLLFDWGEQARKIAIAYKNKPCDHQRRKAVWRGATTGLPMLSYKSWRNGTGTLPRTKLVEFSKKHPELLDAAFTKVVQIDKPEELQKYLTANGMFTEKMDDDTQRCYAAVVVIDGNTGADRLPRQLAYGIPVVLLHNQTLSHGNEFWYDELRPGVDYVAATQETLQPTLSKLLGDANLQKCVGENGRRYVESALGEGRLKCYMHSLLQEYGKRYRSGYR